MARWQWWAHLWLALALLGGGFGAGFGSPESAPPAAARPSPATIGANPPTPPGCGATTVLVGPIAVNQPIPDTDLQGHPGILTSTVLFSGFPSLVYIWDVNVSVNITHTFSGDLQLFLISPHGTRVSLSTNNGGSLNDIYNGATFDDQAGLTNPPGPVTLAAFHDNTGVGLVNPEEPLSAFNGENPNGTWTLEVRDTTRFDTGVLKSWMLQITAFTSVPALTPPNKAVSLGQASIPDNGLLVYIPMLMFSYAPLGVLTLTTVITDRRPADLIVNLVSPAGVTLTVSNLNPATTTSITTSVDANVFAGTTWDDQAGAANPPGPVTDNDTISGTVETPLAPQEAFAEINGIDSSGVWHLQVQDTKANGLAAVVGQVTLQASVITCLPQLSPGVGLLKPYSLRLGKAAVINALLFNDGTPASDVLLKTDVGGPYRFQSAGGAGWTCAPLAVGTLSPKVDCLRPTFGQTTSTVNVTVTAPSLPEPTFVTVTATSSQPNTLPNSNNVIMEMTAFAQSANGNPWDVLDFLNSDFGFPRDSGLILSGGQNAFFHFGGTRLRLLDLSGNLLDSWDSEQLDLAYSPGHRWQSFAEGFHSDVGQTRAILAPAGADWLRYIDAFSNLNGFPVRVLVSWGGSLGSRAQTKIAASSSGDLTLAADDTWGVTFRQNQPNGPAITPPVGFAFRSPHDSTYQGPYIFSSHAFTSTVWPSLGNPDPGQVYSFVLQPNETRSLAYFLARGLAEGVPGPQDCDFYGGCVTPATGSQVALIEQTTAALAANPPFCDLTTAQRAQIVNWPGISEHCSFIPLLFR